MNGLLPLAADFARHQRCSEADFAGTNTRLEHLFKQFKPPVGKRWSAWVLFWAPWLQAVANLVQDAFDSAKNCFNLCASAKHNRTAQFVTPNMSFQPRSARSHRSFARAQNPMSFRQRRNCKQAWSQNFKQTCHQQSVFFFFLSINTITIRRVLHARRPSNGLLTSTDGRVVANLISNNLMPQRTHESLQLARGLMVNIKMCSAK